MLQNVFVPDDIGAAVARLAAPNAALLAGGTLLMPAVNTEATPIETLVSTRRLPLRGIAIAGDCVRLGAGTTLAEVGRDPRLGFLRPTIEAIASPIVRNLATVGGNLFAPQPYGDLAVALLALDAVALVAGPDGERESSVAEILSGGVAAGEIVTAIAFDAPALGTWFFTKAMRRKLNSAAIVAVAARITEADGVVADARVALGGCGPRPVRARQAEAALRGKPLDYDAVAAAAERTLADAQPFSDAYASAWYRGRVLPVHFRRAILGAQGAAKPDAEEPGPSAPGSRQGRTDS